MIAAKELLRSTRSSQFCFTRIVLRVASQSRKMSSVPALVSCQWLKERRAQPDFFDKYIVLDATWDLKMMNRDFVKEHFDCRIPGARRFDLDECADKSSVMAHMLPTAAEFSRYVSHLGVKNSHHVILYDNSQRFGLFSAPRIWWTFRVFSHDRISVLDGGLPKWVAEGNETCSGEYDLGQATTSNEEFKAVFRPELVIGLEKMLDNAKSSSPVQAMDARPSGRFMGTAPEPNKDITSGHMPNTVNVPFFNCFDLEKKMMKPKEQVQEVFAKAGIDLDRQVIATCGSGVSASVLALAAFYVHGQEVPVYDGSWTEWATSDKVTPDMILKSS